MEMIDKAHTIWGSDALLIHVQRGLGKLKSQTFSEEEKVTFSLLLNGKPLMALCSDNYYCPTCEKLIKSGYGLENIDDSLIQSVKESQQAQSDLYEVFEKLNPLLALLENGLYMISRIEMSPTDGEGSFFWTCNDNKCFKATADIYYNFHVGTGWPNFLYPTQPVTRFNVDQMNHYRKQIKTGISMTGLAFYMDGFFSALLDGHHRATAACLEGQKINCLTIMKVNGYRFEKGKEISQIWAGGNSFAIDILKHKEKVTKLLLKHNEHCKQAMKGNKVDFPNHPNYPNPMTLDLVNQLNSKAKDYPDYLSAAYKSMLDDISFDRLKDLWDKHDDDALFEFEILLKILVSQNPEDTYTAIKRIISDVNKREFWELAYNYLATFNNEEVEDIFINYLLDSQPDKHDKIRQLADEFLRNR